MNKACIYSGNSNLILAQKIAQDSGLDLAEVEITRFKNDEKRVWVKKEKACPKAIIIQSLSKPVDENIVEFVLIADAVKRLGAEDITAVFPFLAYSKQDKVFRTGEPLSVKVIAKMLEVVPLKRIYSFDLHNPAISGFFDVPLVNLTARPIFEEYFRKSINSQTVVVAPDAGAIKSSTSFAESLGIPVCYIDKKRDLSTGKINIIGISRDVKGADVIIIDDLIVTGSTMIEATQYLRNNGVKTIRVAATHHLYVDGVEDTIEKSGIDEVIVTDTVKSDLITPKLKKYSVSGLVAREIKKSII